ncbi:alpha/beta hydrolase [Mammaliicoccus vitulinus]|uniref:alpha/beta hydrolase n=1 Tax=Mammaliicoccus vitulinus TaxID=71237 RepID=UPI00145BD867|nr:steryl acetyl hydrolase [Mammaliicoccus vitulinus]QJF24044.1 steryl acetyl hydrolase [Mammaliicoccus vitulinus]
MEYFLQENPNSDTLIVLFHGTGGNQYQLLPFSGALFPEANVLSMQGSVGEGKERRFFAPLNHNELDREDFNKQTESFVEFWNSFTKAYTFKNVIFLGYSNGANFILGILEHSIVNVDCILLLHPSDLAYNITKSYQDTSLIITTGSNDYLTVPGKVKALSKALQPKFKDVQFELLDGGHELDEPEIKLLKTIL